ncbi:unnamed protein product [Toxocara canis]|uniref:Bestrophin homolog n=1 Tax=Toxocara canis TaxID=6265 RepID=A0A183V7G8_TOXCA|nr:unnamed protein product [Toxocara canis]
MTVTYTLEVSQARFWGFPKLLARWRGSIYRLMYREMCAFLAAYYIVAFIYRYAASTNMQRRFERFAVYCKEFTAVVPITFVLGFYVAFVVGRWWQQYISIPWPDRIAMQISVFVQGADERGRLIRRALVRYLNLLAVLTFQSTSTVIKKRFPTIEHLVDAGLLTANERADLEATVAPHGIWWIPAQWFAQLAMVARKEGRIFDDMHLKSLIDVVTIAVYSFFASCLFGRQYLLYGTKLNERHEVDYYVPVFTILQFFFYVGWLKVAESMICPFGEDDDDFDMNWLVDRNVQVGYVIVDQMHSKYPKLSRDIFWDNLESEMPYTQAAANYKREPFFGSTTAMKLALVFLACFHLASAICALINS